MTSSVLALTTPLAGKNKMSNFRPYYVLPKWPPVAVLKITDIPPDYFITIAQRQWNVIKVHNAHNLHCIMSLIDSLESVQKYKGCVTQLPDKTLHQLLLNPPGRRFRGSLGAVNISATDTHTHKQTFNWIIRGCTIISNMKKGLVWILFLLFASLWRRNV